MDCTAKIRRPEPSDTLDRNGRKSSEPQAGAFARPAGCVQGAQGVQAGGEQAEGVQAGGNTATWLYSHVQVHLHMVTELTRQEADESASCRRGEGEGGRDNTNGDRQ